MTTSITEWVIAALVIVSGLFAVMYGFLTKGPGSLRAEFERNVAAGFARPLVAPIVTESDMAGLPEPVRRYLRATGVVGHATMRVKIAGAIPMVDAHGEVMDRSETVTLFNDMCLLAPATFLDRNDYGDFGDARLAAHGEARWSLPQGEFTYGEFELLSVSYNVRAETARR
jgi:hypothetical protein